MIFDLKDARSSLGRNLTHGLLDHIGRQIVSGAYKASSFPTEAELSAEHGVSRSVTREAVKMLTAKGLLIARPRQGTSIQPVSHWNLFDASVLRWVLESPMSLQLLSYFNELRTGIEPLAAAIAAERATSEGLAAIEAGFARMIAADAGDDDVLEADIAFHIAILKASGNPFLDHFRDVVSTALRTSIRITNRVRGRTADLAAHGAVKDAILARDPQAARRAMTAIIEDVADVISQCDIPLPD